MIFAHFLWETVFLREELQTDVKNSNFKILESALYLKSGSMPLNKPSSLHLKQQQENFVNIETIQIIANKNVGSRQLRSQQDKEIQSP